MLLQFLAGVPVLSHEYEAAQTLRESGHRLTPQRLMIISVVRHSVEHLTAAEILARVKDSYPYVDASTVYRTLAVLREMRLVSEADLGGNEAVYEWIDRSQRHHHLICRGCQRVTLLDHAYIEDLGAEVLADYGFRADLDHLALFGVCEACRVRDVTDVPTLAHEGR